MSAHANCTHPKTKSARAACRKAAGKTVAPVAIAPLATEIQTPVAPSHTIQTVTDATVREVSMSGRIDSYQLAMTTEKVNKINARAAKKGLAGTLTLTAHEVIEVEVDEVTKIRTERVMYDVEIIGNAPAFNGWEFVAKLDWDANAGLIVRSIPGAVAVDRENLRQGWCDHCRTTRQRLVTYVVRESETGRQIQVGSSCLKDFTGQYTTIAFPELKGEDDEEGGFFGGRGEREYTPLTVLAVAWACVKLEGFKPASNYGDTTKGDVMTALNPSRAKADREFAAKIAPLADEAMGKAKELLAFLLSDDFNGTSDYVLNMKAVAAGKMVSARNIGLLASAPQAWAKHMERTLIREREASIYAASEFIGQEKERLELTVEVKGIKYIPGDYGTRTLYTLLTEDGNIVKWFSTGEDKLGEDKGARFVIRGTVKKHETWNDMKSTVLTRCSVIEELEPASE
ncbi:hypothetical protein SEA_ZUKO_84 [Streptomyces phage Zuko]|uniref:Uncharacterized protein n=1 Tax=Streptomyces phage Zuko TaxID=2601695 RepID=A0A5J6D705_9CAUD|nr:hypothetical protein PP630_gp084 [Streptomyces phage Zuko]QEQ93662.1 hypothetical protein SEA_ZUKO_84 [Streptomyces phage Zuko]